jgi:SAM-dependent methyltransferase
MTTDYGRPVELAVLLQRWRDDLAAWSIPEPITAGCTESPWVLPREVFARRARKQRRRPVGLSYELAWQALALPGTVLDVGAGAGAASLPLAARCTGLTAVDTDQRLLAELAGQAALDGLAVRTVHGRWPDASGLVEPADVVTCHHVLYNVADVQPFVTALTARARRLVVAEMTARHPLTELNELWWHFHRIRRPVGPTADDVLAILRAMGLRPRQQAWTRPATVEYASFDELVDVTRRRLCLPPQRAGEVADALAALRDSRPDLGSSGRQLVTVSWSGGACEP